MTKSKNTQYKNQYAKDNYDQIRLVVKKGLKDKYKKLALDNGKSLNGFINDLLENELKKAGEE